MWTLRPYLEPILYTIRTEFAIEIYHEQYKFLKKL